MQKIGDFLPSKLKVAKLATLIIQVMQKSPVGKFKLWGSSDNISKYHKPALEALGDLRVPKPQF